MRFASYLMAAACVVAVLYSFNGLVAQDNGGPRERDGRPNFRQLTDEQREALRERMRERLEQAQQRERERMQRALGMSDEEFAAVRPMIERVRRYKREREVASRAGMRGFRGGPGGPGASFFFGGEEGEGAPRMSAEGLALRQAVEGLEQAVEDESLGTDQVRMRIEAVREARGQMDKTIEQAEGELRGVLLARQEAVLLLRGVFD